MIDDVVMVCVVAAALTVAVNILIGPFMIGKERKPYLASDYMVLAGRVMGWW